MLRIALMTEQILLLLLLACAKAGAYTAYIADEGKLVYRWPTGDQVVDTLRRGEIVLPAAGMLDFGNFFVSDIGIALSELKAKRGRFRVLLGEPSGPFSEGYVDTSFVRTPFYYKGDELGYISLDDVVRAYTLLLDERAHRDFEPPRIQNSFTVGKGFDETWIRIIGALAAEQIPIDVIAKDSGLITTKTVQDPLGDTMACATALDSRGQLFFNIFIQPDGEECTVIINSTFTAMRDGESIPCYSNGTIEEWLIGKIR